MATSASIPGDGCLARGPLQGDCEGTVPMRSYDVFINHRGPDVKNTLVSHLCAALKTVNFSSFVDNEAIQIGDLAREVIKGAIACSQIHVSIFSPAYAESSWCLDELHFIMECSRNKSSKLFLPVFFHVSPSDLRPVMRSGESCYSSAFQEYASRYEVGTIDNWEKALHEAATYKGFIFPSDFGGNEARLVESIVSKVIEVLSHSTLLHGPEHPVGVDEKLQEALYLMMQGGKTREVHKFGIYGMGGLGKTTLAKSIFNRIHREFESACFMQNVSENCKAKGLVGLQKNLLQQLLKTREILIRNSLAFGKKMMQERLEGKKVLIILDDVCEKTQLDELMPPYDCHLGKGSQIVITTRDQQVLMWAQTETRLPMEGLNRDLALQLFKLHASLQAHPGWDFERLAEKVVDACQGLPLALEVLGSYLRGKDTCIWEATIKVLGKNKMADPLRSGVTANLKISFDALCLEEQEMFLDIACFLFQAPRDKAMRIWGSDYGDADAELYLNNLVHKCLVKLDKNGDLTMHDLLCDMGRQIVDIEGKRCYWEKSHLWREEDVESVLGEKIGTCNVRGLSSNVEKEWDTLSFTGMNEMKLLVLNRGSIVGDFSKLPQKLRWLQLRNCPLSQIPLALHLDKVAVLDLEGSTLTSFNCGNRVLQNLKELNLNKCTNLVELSIDFSKSSKSLEALMLSGCVNFEGLPDSIGELNSSLRHLDLSQCSKLAALPNAIVCLARLEELNLRDMVNLVSLPRGIGLLRRLKVLNLQGCSSLCEIRKLPSSLRSLVVGGCKSLRHLDTSGCSKLEAVPDGLETLCELSHLDFGQSTSYNYLQMPMEWLEKLTSLKTLSLPREICIRDSDKKKSCEWIQRMVSIEEVLLPKEPRSRIGHASIIEEMVPESFDINACSGVLSTVSGPCKCERSSIEVMAKGEGGQKYSQALFFWSYGEGLHVGIFRAPHPLVDSLRGGDTIRVRHACPVDGSIQLMYGELEMRMALRRLLSVNFLGIFLGRQRIIRQVDVKSLLLEMLKA